MDDEVYEIGEWKPVAEVMAADPWTQYLHALFWCMGLMTGFGDGDTPETVVQYTFTLVVINLGLFTFAYTVGVLGAIGSQKAQRANDFQVSHHPRMPHAVPALANATAGLCVCAPPLTVCRVCVHCGVCGAAVWCGTQVNIHAIRAFMSNYALSDEIQSRISTYLRHRWDNLMTGQRELVDAAELLEQLPRTMPGRTQSPHSPLQVCTSSHCGRVPCSCPLQVRCVTRRSSR